MAEAASKEDTVVLSRGDSSATVHLFGATVISWKLRGKEQLFVSSTSHFDNKKAIRGGIPVVFPNFGPWDLGPQHGFARISRWNVEVPPEQDGDGNIRATFSLQETDATKNMWNFRFRLLYEVILAESELKMSFKVDNRDDKAFDFTCLLHTYLHVDAISNISVSGLDGLAYTDKLKDGIKSKEDRKKVTITESVDRVYEGTPSEHKISAANSSKIITLSKTNFPDTVLWNPWKEKAAGMADFNDDGYLNMVCVEAGYVSSRYVLEKGKTFHASQTIAVT